MNMELELVDSPAFVYDELVVGSVLAHMDMECVQYFESVDTETYVVMDGGHRKRIDAPLYILEELLPKDKFFRCGWGHVLNVNRIKAFYMLNDTSVVMDCGDEILISRYQRRAILAVMERLWFAQQRQVG